MDRHEVVADVVDVVPSVEVIVNYANHVQVKFGNELKPLQVREPPVSVSYPADDSKLYTLVMTDPDASAAIREVKHWLVVNIPGSDVAKGEVHTGYRGSGPPPGSGLHRYIFFVFQQPGHLTMEEPKTECNSREGRLNFKTRQFAEKYALGQPVAWNFYRAQYDDSVVYLHANSTGTIKFVEAQIVPDVLDYPPFYPLELKYDSGVEAQLGNELTPTQVKNRPTKISWPVEEGALYTLIFSDPDAPSRENPVNGEFLHYLVVNIQGTDVDKGNTLAEYIGSGPPKGTGLHRYVWNIFKQPSGPIQVAQTKIDDHTRDGRPKFHVRDFIKENKLPQPLAGNFYLAQFDDYVPILHAQLAPK